MTEKNRKLVKGVAYHGNRFLTHIRDDMRDIAEHGFNTVVHMFSHNDWDRHKSIMKEIFDITKSYGLDVWVDNWGLGGPPGDKSHFLSYHPQAHQYYANGEMAPVHVCYNAPEFVQFTKDWIDTVGEAGGDKIFWDEPHLMQKKYDGGDVTLGNEMGTENWTCRCERCQKLFEEKYGKPMPRIITPEVAEFRTWSIANYFNIVAGYAKQHGMYNSVCVMLGASGISLENMSGICGNDALDNIGSDPYWSGLPEITGYAGVYKYVYEKTRINLEVCEHFGKDHNVWVQGYRHDRGKDEEVVAAADAMYDAGARNIFVWGYRGCEGNDYRAECPDMLWDTVGQAMVRITERWRNEQRDLIRGEMGLK